MVRKAKKNNVPAAKAKKKAECIKRNKAEHMTKKKAEDVPRKKAEDVTNLKQNTSQVARLAMF